MTQQDRKKRLGSLDTRRDGGQQQGGGDVARGQFSQTTPSSSRERRGTPGQGNRKQPETGRQPGTRK